MKYKNSPPHLLSLTLIEKCANNCIDDVREIWQYKSLRTRLDIHTAYLAFLFGVKQGSVELMKIIYKGLVEDGRTIPDDVLVTSFNVACKSGSVEALGFLNKEFEIIELIAKNNSLFSMSLIMKAMEDEQKQLRNNTSISFDHQELVKRFDNIHGFIHAAQNGQDSIIGYIFVRDDSIPLKLLEAGFIFACDKKQFSTAAMIGDYMHNTHDVLAKDSGLLNHYIKGVVDPNIKEFFNKLTFKEELNVSLGNSKNPTSSIRKNKI